MVRSYYDVLLLAVCSCDTRGAEEMVFFILLLAEIIRYKSCWAMLGIVTVFQVLWGYTTS